MEANQEKREQDQRYLLVRAIKNDIGGFLNQHDEDYTGGDWIPNDDIKVVTSTLYALCAFLASNRGRELAAWITMAMERLAEEEGIDLENIPATE